MCNVSGKVHIIIIRTANIKLLTPENDSAITVIIKLSSSTTYTECKNKFSTRL